MFRDIGENSWDQPSHLKLLLVPAVFTNISEPVYFKLLRIPPSKKHMIWLTAYDESRAIRDVKRGEVSPSRNTGTFQTVFDSHF